MSLCRFSSNDFQCDVYTFADVNGGYTTHVAGNRVVFSEPLPAPVPFDKEHVDAYVQRQVRVGQMVDQATRVPIDLPHAGESFYYQDAETAADTLEMLRTLGYNIPQYAIDALREDDDTEAHEAT